MTEEGSHRLPVSRRRFVAATALMASTAGCSSLTRYRFEAAPVGLLEEDRNDLSLEETTLESVTADMNGPANIRLELTSHAGVYSRAAGLGGT
ncbi:MAG: hypothetical protein V5A46_03935 [Haloferacaceae archaeon]